VYNPSDFCEYLDDLAITEMEAEGQGTQDWAKRFADNPTYYQFKTHECRRIRWTAG